MNIKIISEIGEVLKKENIKSVSIPSVDGDLEILSEHENLISILKTGKIQVNFDDASSEIVFISSGILKIDKNEILILAEHADLAKELIAKEIEESIERAKNKIGSSVLKPAEIIRLERLLRYKQFKKTFFNA